jgi:Ca2+-dependent lipid-binding protein
MLRIIIYEAKRLKNADIGSLSDPFVVCKLDKHLLCKTRVVRNELDPKFYQVFNIVVTNGMMAAGDEFVLEVRHSSKLTSSLLGRTEPLRLGRYRIISVGLSSCSTTRQTKPTL